MSYVEVGYQMSERHACRLRGLGRSTHRYRARKAERDRVLRTRLKELAARRMRFGYRRLTAMLLREGMPALGGAIKVGSVGEALTALWSMATVLPFAFSSVSKRWPPHAGLLVHRRWLRTRLWNRCART